LITPLVASSILLGQSRLSLSGGPSFIWFGQNARDSEARAELGHGLQGARAFLQLRSPWSWDAQWDKAGLLSSIGVQHATFDLEQNLHGRNNRYYHDVLVRFDALTVAIGPWWTLSESKAWWFSVGPSASFVLRSSMSGMYTEFERDKAVAPPSPVNGTAKDLMADNSFALQGQLFWNTELRENLRFEASALISRSFSSPLRMVDAVHLWDAGLMAGLSYSFAGKPTMEPSAAR
jgi:hypothetical protein